MPNAVPAASLREPILPLPGVIGSELARPVTALQILLQQVRSTRSISSSQLTALEAAVQATHRIALQSQQITRLAGGRLRQSHERLRLHSILMDVLESRRKQFRQEGVQVRHRLKPVEVIVDPGLLFSLLETAVDWAIEQGHALRLSLDIKNWPEHGVLVLKTSQPVRVAGEEKDAVTADTLNWHLLMQTAHAMGVMVDRIVGPDSIEALIEFPRTVRQLEGLTAVEMDMGPSGLPSSFHSESKPLAGHRLLLVTMDEKLRGELLDICEQMGLVLDSTQTSAQAVRFCEADTPHIVVIDERLHDNQFEALRRDLMRSNLNFPMVEILDAAGAVEMSNWMGNSMSRLGRDAVSKQLASILMMELAKIA